MLAVAGDLLRLDAVRSLFRFTSRYFASPKLRQVFSFETLLIGGNPLRVPAIYAMIHFVEKTWGIHYVMGGTGALVPAIVKKFEELGGVLRLNADVRPHRRGAKPPAACSAARASPRGVTLADGRRSRPTSWSATPTTPHLHEADRAEHRFWNSDLRVRKPCATPCPRGDLLRLQGDEALRPASHHNIILGPRYEGLLTDIFDNLIIPEDFSQYLHIPTLTDPSMAPEGHHAAYTLIPVPTTAAGWTGRPWATASSTWCCASWRPAATSRTS
jgi:phytoene desaturase